MILDLDIGNVLSKWRLKDRKGNEIRSRGIVSTHGEWQPGRNIPGLGAVEEIRVSSVVEASVLRGSIDRFRHEVNNIHVARSTRKILGVTNGYDNPSQLRVDRWLGILAGFQLTGGCCIVDCGSLITIDFVVPSGRHLGGYELPGLGLMKEILQLGTSNVVIDPDSEAEELLVPGRRTMTAVNHGTYIAVVSAINRLYLEVCDREEIALTMLVTGEDAEAVSRGVHPPHAIWPDLVYGGLEVCFPLTASERAGKMSGAPNSVGLASLDTIRATLGSILGR